MSPRIFEVRNHSLLRWDREEKQVLLDSPESGNNQELLTEALTSFKTVPCKITAS